MPGLGIFTRYERSWLPSDLGAGLSVAAIALPVGIAYANRTRAFSLAAAQNSERAILKRVT